MTVQQTNTASHSAQSLYAASKQAKKSDPVNDDERAYFQQLFPGSAAEIKDHTTYTPSGVQRNTQSGLMFDRKA
jgi:hypothetical protein